MGRALRSSRAMPQPRYNACPISSKVGYVTSDSARMGAHRMARHALQRGQLVDSVYSYKCDGCERLHLTRIKNHRGRPANREVLPAAPLDVQLWAMTDANRTAAIERLEGDGVASLPDPRPDPVKRQPYANRPRGLRYQS